MHRILISSCLLGQKVRYDGAAKLTGHPVLTQWQEAGWLIPICPEVAAGFSTPRPPAEITDSLDGAEVLAGRGHVIEQNGQDVTEAYVRAGEIALNLAQEHGCQYAILTDGSPSCGSSFIYDGTFSGTTQLGQGTTAALLRANGVQVFNENQIEELARLIGDAPIQ